MGGREDDLSRRVWLLLSQEISSWWMLRALRAGYIRSFLVKDCDLKLRIVTIRAGGGELA